MNARPYWVFFVCKKQQYQGEIALVINLRPLMSQQLLKFGYTLFCLNGEYTANVLSAKSTDECLRTKSKDN